MQLKLLGIQGTTSVVAATAAIKGLSLEEASAALATTNLTEAEIAAVLVKNGFTNATALEAAANIVEAREQEAVAAATLSAAGAETTATATTVGLTGATGALTAAFNGLKVAIMSNPIGLIATIAIAAVVGINALVSSIKSASEKLAESSQEVTDIESKLEGLNSELETTEKRIKELDRMGSLTLVQKNELRDLKRANAELKQKIALQKQLLATAQQANEKGFVSAVNSKANSSQKQENFKWYYPLLQEFGGIISWFSKDYGNWFYGSTTKNQDKFDEYIKDYNRADEENPTKDVFGNWVSSKSEMRDYMAKYIQELAGYIEELGDYDYDTLSDDAKAAVDLYYDNLNKFSVITGDYANAFDNVYNQDRFAAARDKLEQAAEGGLTKEEVADLYNNDADVKAMIDNMKEVGLISGDIEDNFDGIATQIANADDNIENFSSREKIAFKDLISTEGVQDAIDDFESDLTYLSDALDKCLSGELSDSEMIELFERFPELAGRTDDLDVALEELIKTTQEDVNTQFDEWEQSMPNEEDADNLNAIRNAINKIGDTATGISRVTSEIDKLNDALDDLQDVYEDIDDVIEDYNENGYYSTDNLQTLLSLEPEYLNLLIDENGQLNLNSESYKTYIATKAKSLLLDQVTSLYESILSMKVEEAQAYATASAYDEESSSIASLTKHYYALAQAKDAANNTTAYTDAMKRSLSTVANYAAVYDSWLSSLNSTTNEFTKSTNDSTSALEDQKDALEDAKDAAEDYKDALSDAQTDIQNLIDLTIDYIKQLKEDEKDALEDQKDAYDDIIDKKKEALKLAKEEKEAAEELADYQKAVAKNSLSLAVANLDDSSAGKKAQKKAQDNLIDSRKDLQDYLADQDYDIRVAALEAEQDAFDASIDEQIEKIDEYLDDARKIYEDACDMIDNDTGELYGNLWNYTYKYTTKTRAEFDHLWSSAQTAIQKYKGDNDTLIGTMEYLQGEIYITETKIDELETAIDITSDAIDATSSSIDAVSSSLDGLGTSISDYMQQLNDLVDAANEVTNNTGGGNTWFEVYHNGKAYRTAAKYSGDTEGNRLLAASELTKMIAQDVSGFDTYGLGIVQGYLGVGNGSAKQWYFDWNGTRYTAVSKSKGNAVQQILDQLGWDTRGGYKVAQGIKHYYTGTYSSDGGISVTQENGLLEAIFGKLSNGKYTFMNDGSHVFDAEATQNLHEFMDNPSDFMARKMKEINYEGFLKSYYGDTSRRITESISSMETHEVGDTEISAPVTIHIQGDATQSTITALRKEAQNIKEDTIKTVLHYANIYKKPLH